MSIASAQASLDTIIDGLVARARRDQVPELVVEKARRSTRRAMLSGGRDSRGIGLQRRAEAYFSACIRRAAVRGGAGPQATARLIASSVVADLLDAGRDQIAAWQELERGWGQRLPQDVLEEYRLKLCG